jgi:hypothetical protein
MSARLSTTNHVILAGTVALAASLAATAAFAEGDNWRRKLIDAEQQKEQAAIEQGRYTGSLTRREYRGLLSEQQRIADLERKAKEDGYVSRREFRDIRQAQEQANQHITQEANDGQVSFWRRWLYRSRY